MPEKKKKFPLSRRAVAFIAAGILFLTMPYLVAQEGYAGKILVAGPDVSAPFDKTLILVGRHNIDGAAGFIVNRPLPEDQRARLSAFIRDAGIPVGYGGPLDATEQIFVLEEKSPAAPGDGPDFDISAWDDAVKATPDLLNRIRRSVKNGEQHYRVLTGYVGWGSFQLETEVLIRKSWDVIAARHDLVFQNGDGARWDALARKEKAAIQKPLSQK